MRYCSARGIAPGSVDDKIFDEYWRYRAETTALASNNTARRLMARSVECLRGCNRRLAAAAARRAAHQGQGRAGLG